jgi:hypothetical protein
MNCESRLPGGRMLELEQRTKVGIVNRISEITCIYRYILRSRTDVSQDC